MRVLYASHTSVVSGAERTLLDLLRALPSELDAFVACPDGQLRREVAKLSIPCVGIVGTSGSLRIHPAHSSRALAQTAQSAAQLRAAAARLEPDVIHANSIRAGLILAAAGVLARPPALTHLHDVLPAGRVGGFIARGLAASSRVILANSRYTADDFARKSGGRGIVEVVDNPVDLKRFDPSLVDRSAARARFGFALDRPLLGVIAQVTPWKGQSDAIRALALARREHPELMLVIAGTAKFVDPGTRYDNAAYARSLRALAAELDVEDAVVFSGEVDDVPTLIAALDLVLVPSWEEPFGRVVIEAMAMRTPVLATSVGGPAEIVTDGVDGLLLAPQSPAIWGTQVARLLRHRDEMTAMGAAARITVSARYDVHAFTRAVVESYGRALDSRTPARRGGVAGGRCG